MQEKEKYFLLIVIYIGSAATISNAEPITNFEISPGGTNLIKLTDEDQIVNVQYATGTGSTLTATLNSDPIPSSDITHSETSKTGAVTIKTSHPVFTSYGIYDLTLELLNNEGKKHLNLYIFHEAKVAGLPPPGRKHFCNINETYVIEFDLVSGSNVLSEWMFEQYSILQIYSGDINRLWKNYSCDAILKDNVTVVAANNASAEYTWFLLTVQYPVNHIVASVDSPVAETSSNLKFDIQTQSEALTPMGTLQAQIFYHTGENETKSFTPGESTEFFKSFTTQGQFKANLSIWSESSSDNLEVDFAIWDKLEDLTLEPKKPYAEVGKVVIFEFINPPPSGFEYKIIYGNSKQASNTEDDLYLPFSQAPLNTTYSEPITYYISMRSFNPEYEKNYTTSIIIQNAVGNLTLTPSSLVIPYDNSTVEFTLSMEHEMPPPTSVSCVFTYGDGNDENVTLDLTWTSPFSHLYTYSNIGNYSVNVFCSNQISNITLFSSIGVRYYTIDDVNLFHQNPFPTNFTEGRDVEFSLRIKDLDVTPPNTQLTWNFGDDSTPLVQTFNEWILVHHFPKRDIFMGMLEINMSNETKTITFTQQIGTVTISSDILIVLAGNPVLFTTQIINTGSVEPLSYQIDFGDGTVPVSSQNFSHSFADGGYYIATAKVFNSTFSEFNTVEDVLVVENPLTSLLSVSAQNVAFPPGNFRLSLGLPPGSKPITFVTCEYNFGDTVDNVLHYHTDNISLSHPITFLHTYTKLGPYTILYNCSNVLTSTSGKLSTSVINECFSIIGIFDPQYSYQDNPMRIYTSQLMQISSRLTIYCGEHQPRFVWTLKNITDGNMTNVSLDQPQTDFIRFPKNSIPKGKYILSLNVSFVLKPESWLNEITFLEFRDPPIRAEIVGGFQRTTGMKDITIDAVPLSYDPLKEQGQPDDLSYSWTCKKVNTTTVLELLSKYKNESFSIPCNSVSYQLAAGTLLFKASSEERPIGYIFTLEVNKPGRTAGEFIQTVQVLYEAPDINILCIINCEVKVALSTELSLQTECTSCFPSEYATAVYEWSMSRLLNKRTEVVNIDLTSKIGDTGTNPTSIVINANVFEPGGEYIVEVTVDIPGRLSKGYAAYVVNANLPPYNGSCKSVPTEGIVSETKFQIICENYMDEGFRSERNEEIDGVEPMSYKYVIKKGDQTIPLDDGVESTSAELEVPIFPGAVGTDYQLVTYVYDILQDYAVSYMDITLKTPLNDTSHTDASTQVSNIMTANEEMLKDIDISGSTVRFTRVVNSVVSVVQSIELPDNTILFDEADDIVYDENSTAPDWRTVYTDFLKPKDTEAEDKVKKIGEIQMKALLHRKDDVLNLNGGGVKQLTATVSNILRNPKASSLDTATMGSKLALASANGLEGIIKHRPYTFRDEIGTAVAGMAEMMGGILKTTVPDLKGRVPTLDKDAILLEVEATGKGGPGISREEAAHLAYKIAESEQVAVEKQKQTTRSMIVDVEDSLDKSQNALSSLLVRGQEAKTIVKEELTLSARKLSPDVLAKVDIKAGEDITVNLPGANDTGVVMVNDNLDIQTTVFKTNPYTWGKNDSSYDIESKVVRMKVKTENGTTIKMPVTLKLKTENPPDFKGFGLDETVKGDEGMHYHTFPLRKTFDVCTLYVAAPINVINVTAYLRINKTPKVNKYDYKTYGVNDTLRGNAVFKITAPPDTFPDVGTVIAGLVFLEGERPPDIPNLRRKRSAANNSTMPNTTEAPGDSNNVTDSSLDNGGSGTATVVIDTVNETLATFDKYSVLATTDGCRVWDENTEAWDPRACKISPYSTPDETICVCDDPPGTSFASSFYVPPNTIDFNVIWTKFDVSNASIYGSVIAILVLYSFIAMWTNRKDEQDKERWCVGYLTDNLSDDRHFYLLTVYTGLRKNAGTKSGIYFIMAGTQGDTGVRCLSDGKRDFETSSVLNLVCSSSVELGDLTYFRVWHDNKGHGSNGSWFLSKIIVQDLQTHQRYVFLNDRWLGIDKDDGMIDRLIPVACKDDLMTFDKLFSAHARLNVTDAHLWLSVFLRPDKSTFSRLQRSACCLSLLFLTMIVNAVYFNSKNNVDDEETVSNDFQIGILRFSMTSIFNSFISVGITVPPLILLVFIFKSSKPPPDYFKLKQNSSCICCRKKKQIVPKIVVEEPEGDDILDNANVNKMLPNYCIKIGWAIVVIIVLASSNFLILYSMEWGKSISEEWLAAFFLSFFENLFVMDPAKVLLMSVLLACLLRSPYNQVDKVNVEKVQTEVEKFGLTEVDVSQLPPDPIPESLMEKARQRRKEELKAQSVFMNLILYGVFLFALYAVCYGNRDTSNFAFQTHIEQDIFTGSFENIQSYDDFFDWANDQMVPSLFPVGNFRGDKLSWRERLFYNDHVNFRVGPARIRQVRIKERPPPYYGTKYMNLIEGYSYYWPYTSSQSETADYCPGWNPQPCSLDTRLRSSTLDAWLHATSEDAWGMPISGHLDLYQGDGYFLEMSVNRDVSMDKLKEIKNYGWLDRQTRAVFVEFSLYNANKNLLTFVQLIAEFPEFGSVLTWKQIQTLRVFQNVGPIGAFIILCEIIVLIILMVFGYKCIKLLIKQKFAFFISFWNIMDLLTFITTIFGVAFFICREVYSSLTLTKFRADPKKFVNFEHIVLWDSLFVHSLSFLVFTATIGMLRILGYNRRFTMIGEVLRASAKGLIGFAFVFGIFYFAYIASGYVLFMTKLKQFRSPMDAGVSIFTYLLGKNQLGMMLGASDGLGALYFFTLVFFVILILLTMFQAIMNNTMTVVRSNVTSIPPPYGIVNVLTNIYKSVITDWIPSGMIKKNVEEEKQQAIDLEMRRRRSQVHNILETFKEQFEKSLDVKGASARDKRSFFDFEKAFDDTSNQLASDPGPSPSGSRLNLPSSRQNAPR